MGATETAKEVVRIATTAGLAKDVIDLLEKKAGLLKEQVDALETENASLLRENRNLTLENKQLKSQLPYTHPPGDGLSEKTREILLHYFRQARQISEMEIAHHFQLELSVASYHLDLLSNKEFIRSNAFVVVGGFGDDDGDTSFRYEITAEGRAYCIEKGLVR